MGYFCLKYELGIFVALIGLCWLKKWLKKQGLARYGKVGSSALEKPYFGPTFAILTIKVL